jgi:2-haloacid dehalogenase
MNDFTAVSDGGPGLKALVFDVQGTATDFRSTLAQKAQALAGADGAGVDWGAFVDEWRGRYRPAIDAVLSGARPWRPVDRIYRESLDDLLREKGYRFFDETQRRELNFAWQQIRPWPDVVEGMRRLKTRYILATLSNADVSALVNISRAGSLAWDAIFATEMAGTFKPDPRTYQLALRYLGLQPSQAMMVACHKYDLHAARAQGMRTAFVARPLEFGPDGNVDVRFEPVFDVNARDFLHLAEQLGC